MLLRHTLLYLPAQVIGPAVQFVSILIWAHLMDPAALGLTTLIIAVQELSFATYLWWSHYALRYIRSFGEGAPRRDFERSETCALAISVAVSTAIMVPAVALFFGDRLNGADLALVAGFMATRSLVNYLGERARAEAKILLYTVTQALAPAGGLVLGLLLMLIEGYTFRAVLLGFVISNAFLCVAGFWALGLRGRLGPPKADILRQACSFGLPLMMSGAFVLVALNAPRFIVEHRLGLDAAGLFAVGYGLGLRASGFAVMLVTAGAYPLVVKQMELHGLKAAYEQLRTNTKLVIASVAPVALGLLALNQSVVDTFVPENLRAATYVILPLSTMAGLIRNMRAHTIDQVFLVRSRTRYLTIISIVDMLVAVGATFVALDYVGLAGAGYGPLLTSVGSLVVSVVITSTVFEFRPPWMAIIKLLAAASVMALCVGAFPKTNTVIGLAWRGALGAGIYAALILALLPEYRTPLLARLRRATLLARGRDAPVG